MKTFETFKKDKSTNLEELLLEIKNTSEDEINEMLNENKLSLEKIAYELIEQKKNISKLNDNMSSLYELVIKIIKENNLKVG